MMLTTYLSLSESEFSGNRTNKIMIKNYFKLGFRNLAKNRLSSSINILGLALAVGCCMVVFEFFDWSMHMDNFHHKINNLFVVERVSQKGGNEQLWGNSPSPL